MTEIRTVVFTALALAMLSTQAFAVEDSNWMLGFWQQISDEDHGTADYFEVLRDGTFINHGYCIDSRAAGYGSSHWHMNGGDLYQTFEIKNKGPIALIYRPDDSKTRLTYTSPRTRNNAVYEHRAVDPCVSGGMKAP